MSIFKAKKYRKKTLKVSSSKSILSQIHHSKEKYDV